MDIDSLIPAWVGKENIRLFAGIEAIAKRENGIWHIKNPRCNRCGKCCKDVCDNWPRGKDKDTNDCLHLRYEANEYLCGLGFHRPFSCCAEGAEGEAFCNANWEKVK